MICKEEDKDLTKTRYLKLTKGGNKMTKKEVFGLELLAEGFFDAENPYVLSMEVSPRPGEDEEIVLANTKRVIKRAWALLED